MKHKQLIFLKMELFIFIKIIIMIIVIIYTYGKIEGNRIKQKNQIIFRENIYFQILCFLKLL